MEIHLTIEVEERPHWFRRFLGFLRRLPCWYWREMTTNRTFCLVQISSIGLAITAQFGPVPFPCFVICIVGFLVGVRADLQKTKREISAWKEQRKHLDFFVQECKRLGVEFHKTPEWDTAKRRAIAEQFDVVRVRFEREARAMFGDKWDSAP